MSRGCERCCSYGSREQRVVAAERIALMHAAEKVMAERHWSPMKSPLATEGWRVDTNDGCYFAFGREDEQGVQPAHWPDPFTALVEADKWCTANGR